jgi:hypothetical protein
MSKSKPIHDYELHPDAWERFERAVDAAAKAPPQHRKVKKAKRLKKRASKKK